MDARQFAAAEAALEKAAALAPEDPSVLQLRFKYCWLREDYPAARQTLLRLNQVAPNDQNARRLTAVEEKLRAAGDSGPKSSG